MSNNNQQGGDGHFQSNNPYQSYPGQPQYSNPGQGGQQQFQPPPGPPPSSRQQHDFAPPPGPPPSQYQQAGHQAPIGAPPRRAGTFDEANFVPADERGEQREAMENFEMKRTKPEDRADQDVAQLQREFPNLDGSLIAAIYSDAQSLGATREMLQELAQTT